MNINSIKPSSSTILALNYLGMRKRCKKQWTTANQVAEFFPHIFRKKNRSQGSDTATVLNRLCEAGFLKYKYFGEVKKYAITEEGQDVPFKVAQRLKNSPYYSRNNSDED